jgi:hypothetical protein
MSDRHEPSLSKKEKKKLKESLQEGEEEVVVEEAIPITASSTSTTSVPNDHNPGEGEETATPGWVVFDSSLYMGSLATMSMSDFSKIEQKQKAAVAQAPVHRDIPNVMFFPGAPLAINGKGGIKKPFSSFNTDKDWKITELYLHLLFEQEEGFKDELEHQRRGWTCEHAVNN